MSRFDSPAPKGATLGLLALLLAIGPVGCAAPTVDGGTEASGFGRGDGPGKSRAAFVARVAECHQRYLGDAVIPRRLQQLGKGELLEWHGCLHDAIVDPMVAKEIAKQEAMTRQFLREMEEEGIQVFDSEVPTEEDVAEAIQLMIQNADEACVSLGNALGDEDRKVLAWYRCGVAVRGLVTFQLANWIFGDYRLRELLPQSSNPAVNECAERASAKMDQAISTMDMFEVIVDEAYCLRDASSKDVAQVTGVSPEVVDEAIGKVQTTANALCDAFIAVTGQNEGTIRNLNYSGCDRDAELFNAYAVRFALYPPPDTSVEDIYVELIKGNLPLVDFVNADRGVVFLEGDDDYPDRRSAHVCNARINADVLSRTQSALAEAKNGRGNIEATESSLSIQVSEYTYPLTLSFKATRGRLYLQGTYEGPAELRAQALERIDTIWTNEEICGPTWGGAAAE